MTYTLCTLFLILCLIFKKRRGVDRQDAPVTESEKVHEKMQRMLIMLMFTMSLKCFLEMTYLGYCPWKLEKEK
jgi:hypothetical protein